MGSKITKVVHAWPYFKALCWWLCDYYCCCTTISTTTKNNNNHKITITIVTTTTTTTITHNYSFLSSTLALILFTNSIPSDSSTLDQTSPNPKTGKPSDLNTAYSSKMQEFPVGISACFTSGEKPTDELAMVTRSGQSVFMSVYNTKIADQCRLVTITWSKSLLLHGLSVSVEGPEGETQYICKVELKPWYFWRKQRSKHFMIDGYKRVDDFWDLKTAKFNGETKPSSEYYVAVVCDEEVDLLVGDLKKDGYWRTGCRPALIDPFLVSRKEHIFGKKFSTRVKFHEKGRLHEISIKCKNRGGNGNSITHGVEPEMEVSIDGHLLIHVKHLQ